MPEKKRRTRLATRGRVVELTADEDALEDARERFHAARSDKRARDEFRKLNKKVGTDRQARRRELEAQGIPRGPDITRVIGASDGDRHGELVGYQTASGDAVVGGRAE